MYAPYDSITSQHPVPLTHLRSPTPEHEMNTALPLSYLTMMYLILWAILLSPQVTGKIINVYPSDLVSNKLIDGVLDVYTPVSDLTYYAFENNTWRPYPQGHAGSVD